MVVFDSLIWHPHYWRIKCYAVSTFDIVYSVNHENWKYSIHCFSLAMLPNLYFFDSESAWKFCKNLLEEVYMLEQVTTFEETKEYACCVWMSRMTLT